MYGQALNQSVSSRWFENVPRVRERKSLNQLARFSCWTATHQLVLLRTLVHLHPTRTLLPCLVQQILGNGQTTVLSLPLCAALLSVFRQTGKTVNSPPSLPSCPCLAIHPSLVCFPPFITEHIPPSIDCSVSKQPLALIHFPTLSSVLPTVPHCLPSLSIYLLI